MNRDALAGIERVAQLLNALAERPGSWMGRQGLDELAPLTVEEVWELNDALQRGDARQIEDELGDLLIHLIRYAQIAEAQGLFDLAGVAEGATAKLLRRHPSLDDAQLEDPDWEQIKRQERERNSQDGVFDGVGHLPALLRSVRMQRRAASMGFDWRDASGPLAKVHEELGEVDEEMAGSGANLEGELGDLLFACTNLARHLRINPEQALQRATSRFQRRFERVLAELGDDLSGVDAARLEEAWARAKAAERAEATAKASDTGQSPAP